MPTNLRTVFALFLLTMFAAGPAVPAEAICQGQNLLEVLKTEQPKVFRKIEQRAGGSVNGDALLWRIEGRDGTEPSYLLGTLHLPDPRVVDLSPKIRAAIAAVSTVALELTGTDDQAAIQKERRRNRENH